MFLFDSIETLLTISLEEFYRLSCALNIFFMEITDERILQTAL